jgi:hypothetical protein
MERIALRANWWCRCALSTRLATRRIRERGGPERLSFELDVELDAHAIVALFTSIRGVTKRNGTVVDTR